jgi:hypothetical protein
MGFSATPVVTFGARTVGNCLPSFGATTEYDRSGQPMNTTTLRAST